MGLPRKLSYEPKVLSDKIVRDSLEAMSIVGLSEPIFLVGGFGVQSYISAEYFRPTSDLDYAIVKPLTYLDFRKTIKVAVEFLSDKGYSVSLEKGSRAYALLVNSTENDNAMKEVQRYTETFFVELARNNENSFKEKERRLKREFENSVTMEVDDGLTYRVARPEDLSLPKVVRALNSLTRNPDFLFLIKRFYSNNSKDVVKILRKINSFRGEVLRNPGDSYLAEKLRFLSDLYDVRMLVKNIREPFSFDQDYFNERSKDWYSFQSSPFHNKRKILNLVGLG
ncbi:MAG: hypothetical protein QXU40_00310 [Candidatus Pacearchaeota archaeon]